MVAPDFGFTFKVSPRCRQHRIYPFVLFSQHDAAVGLDGDLGAPLLIHL